jgi:hypothetical protein
VENNKWYQSKLGAVFKVKRDFKLQQQELLQTYQGWKEMQLETGEMYLSSHQPQEEVWDHLQQAQRV